MESKMRKWERDYNEKKDKINEDVRKMQQQVEKAKKAHFRKANKKEISRDKIIESTKDLVNTSKELQEMKNIQANIPKVGYILELRNKLREDKNELENEITRRGNLLKEKEYLDKLPEENKALEEELEGLLKECHLLTAELKDSNLTKEQKEEKENKLKKNIEKRAKNNEKFSTNSLKMQKITTKLAEKGNPKFEKMNDEVLKEKSIEISTKISMCNMACNNLMKGESWAQIDIKLDAFKDRTLDAKGEDAQKAKKVKDAIKGEESKKDEKAEVGKENDELDQIRKGLEKNADEMEENSKNGKIKEEAKGNEEETALANVSEFDKKHPKLARFKNWFKDKFKKEQKPVKEEEKPVKKEEPVNKKDSNQEPVKEEEKPVKKEEPVNKKDSNQAFKEYLQQIAEKGMDGVREDKKAILQANKEKAYAERARLDAEYKSKKAEERKRAEGPEL